MIIELAFALILGILAGTFTGLAPGIHINLIASLLLLSQSSPSPDLVLPFVIFIIAMSITHTFIDFIPSIFLGAPEEDTFLSLLPGHELFLEGRAQEAVVLTLYCALAAIPIVLITIPLYLLFLPSIYASFKFLLPFLLIFFSGYLAIHRPFALAPSGNSCLHFLHIKILLLISILILFGFSVFHDKNCHFMQ